MNSIQNPNVILEIVLPLSSGILFKQEKTFNPPSFTYS